MHIPMPMFLLRRLVRENPWLLADNGFMRRSSKLMLGPLELELESETVLTPKQRARLQAEADAGKLFPIDR